MSSQFENIAEISRLLWEGKKEEASNEVISERARFKAIIENANKNLAMLDAISPPVTSDCVAQPPSKAKGAINSISLARDAIELTKQRISDAKVKEQRDLAIIDTAKELGGMYAQFTTVSIANELKEKGIETGVPENRISTVISRLLLRHDQEFEKVETGIYKLRNS